MAETLKTEKIERSVRGWHTYFGHCGNFDDCDTTHCIELRAELAALKGGAGQAVAEAYRRCADWYDGSHVYPIFPSVVFRKWADEALASPALATDAPVESDIDRMYRLEQNHPPFVGSTGRNLKNDCTDPLCPCRDEKPAPVRSDVQAVAMEIAAACQRSKSSWEDGARAQVELAAKTGHNASFKFLEMERTQRVYSWHEVADALDAGSKAIRQSAIVEWRGKS